MTQHYSGELGTFDYNDTIFCICQEKGQDCIRINKGIPEAYRETITIPKGLVDCSGLFQNEEFPKSLTIIFDKDTVLSSCSYMFFLCIFMQDLNIVDLNIDDSTHTDSMFSQMIIHGRVNVNTKLQCRLEECMFDACNLAHFNINIKVTSADDRPFFHADLGTDFFKKFDFSECKSYRDRVFDCDRLFGGGLFWGSVFNPSEMEIKLNSVSNVGCMFRDAILPKKYAKICINWDKSRLNEVITGFIGDNDGIFSEAQLPEFLDLDIETRHITKAEIEKAVNNDGLFKFHNMFKNANMLNGCRLNYIHFSERMFSQPDLYYTDMFEGCELPEYITATNPIEIMRQLNDAYDKATGVYDVDYENCKKDLVKLLKEGKSVGDALRCLKTRYPMVNIDKVSSECLSKLSIECSKNVSSLLAIPVGSEYCRYTIAEVHKKLCEAGYPSDVVDRCIVEYIGDQYISL